MIAAQCKEFQTEPGDRIPLMNRVAAVPFEPLVEVVSEQFDQKVDFVGFKIACHNPVYGKPAFSFLDVVFHTAPLVEIKEPLTAKNPADVELE